VDHSIVPIPGTKKVHRLEENLAAADLNLSTAEVEEIDIPSAAISILGARANRRESYG
jgi:aryl-alcohol dehydrogenase-like predicted oxidoreductase